jgi:hypothetical protein
MMPTDGDADSSSHPIAQSRDKDDEIAGSAREIDDPTISSEKIPVFIKFLSRNNLLAEPCQ